jgi:putative chitinase
MVTAEQLEHVAPTARARIPVFLEPLNSAMVEFGISTPRREAAFLAQCAHESGEFALLEENLNYSADGLLQTFKGRFTVGEAEDYAKHPQRIANRVYASRMGNGTEESGDGWRYRGRGLIQVTGRDNYRTVGLGLDVELLMRPELLAVPAMACRSAGLFWKSHGLNELADAERFDEISKIVNGLFRHLRFGDRDRYAYYEAACAQLGLSNGENVA